MGGSGSRGSITQARIRIVEALPQDGRKGEARVESSPYNRASQDRNCANDLQRSHASAALATAGPASRSSSKTPGRASLARGDMLSECPVLLGLYGPGWHETASADVCIAHGLQGLKYESPSLAIARNPYIKPESSLHWYLDP